MTINIIQPKSRITYLIALCTILPILAGCASRQDIVYLNDLRDNAVIHVQEKRPIKLQPGDRLNIAVHSRDKELVEMFNINQLGGNSTSGGGAGAAGDASAGAYTVDENGQIEMPIIGSVNVKGLTRLELQSQIRYKLLASKLIRDPIVSVEFVNLGYYTVGELGPSRHEIKRDNVTLLEAIAECGDLGLDGRRDNILVLRTVDGKQTPYRVNLTETASLYGSPAYYIQQNDVIYVEPSEMKVSSTSAMGNSFRTPTFWIGMFNFALSMVMLFSK